MVAYHTCRCYRSAVTANLAPVSIGSNDTILLLAARQLEAYNRADVDAFCECFHERVSVLDADGKPVVDGIDAFRARYAALFKGFRDVRATVSERVHLEPHVVERESWSRTDPTTAERFAGEVLVRYSAADGKIRWVQFLRP